MKICCMSDIHGRYHKFKYPLADVLLIAGDLTLMGTLDELEQANILLGTIRHKYKHVFVIAGNHDKYLYNVKESGKKIFTNVSYMQDENFKVDGLKFYFSPWTPRFGDWAFMYSTPEEARKIWGKIPVDTDILVTHGPPAGVSPLDYSNNSYHTGAEGCPYLAEAIDRVRPKYHIFGHIHEGYGSIYKGNTNFLNVSSLKRDYFGTNKPVIIEV